MTRKRQKADVRRKFQFSPMHRTLAVLTVLLFASVASFAQQQCSLPLTASPSIRGLRLGMTQTDLRKGLGITKENQKVFKKAYFKAYMSTGYHLLFFNVSKIPSETFVGLADLGIVLTDQVIEYRVSYEDDGVWTSLNDFVDHTIAELKLPDRSHWSFGNQLALLRCSGFSLDLIITGKDLKLTLRDAGFDQKIRSYRKGVHKSFKF